MRLLPTLLLFLALASQAQASHFQGRVVGLADGDTLTVLDAKHVQHKVRLAGIDAPEKRQAYGQASREHLAKLVFGREVVVDAGKVDRYGRTVGRVRFNGQDVGLEQIRAGLAWHYKAYEREQPAEDRLSYAQAEEAARKAHAGLWHDAAATPPWKWRRSK